MQGVQRIWTPGGRATPADSVAPGMRCDLSVLRRCCAFATVSAMPSAQQRLGDFGERIAAAHLQAKGYRIIDRKYRVRDAEIDLIAIDGDQLVFVEARTRRGAYPGMAALSITRKKSAKLLFAVERYIETHPDVADMPLASMSSPSSSTRRARCRRSHTSRTRSR